MTEIPYDECLEEFKRSLKGGSEFDLIIEGIVQNISTNRIRWFDVGIGDGKFLKKIVDELQNRGFQVEITGVDCSEGSLSKAKGRFPSSTLIHRDFLETELKEKYDVFSFIQTLYYFHNKNQVIEKCLKNLAEGGLILGVCWSKQDAIYKYHQKVFGEWTIGAFTSEDFRGLLSHYNNIAACYVKEFEATVDFGSWKDKESLRKNLNVISRIPLSKGSSEENFITALEMIQGQKDIEARINGVIIAKKSYEIQNFTRENINQALLKRFPNYQDLVPAIKGDLEALFMCSWEKETELLSEYISPGRVLEICCAAGLKTAILAKRHEVVAIDINKCRLDDAEHNAVLFGVDGKTRFLNIDAEDISGLRDLGHFDAIYVDVDWRENLSDPIKKQNIDPFITCPKTDKLYKNLRNIYPDTPIIFKISPFVRVKKLTQLDPCIIEEMYIDGKFLSYNVYFDPKIKKSRWHKIYLSNSSEV